MNPQLDAQGDVISFPPSKLSRAHDIAGQLAEALAADDTAGSYNQSVGAGEQEAVNLGGGSLASVAPATPKLAPLHELEESLMSLLDTEDLVSPEQEQAFLQELSEGMQLAKAKRDRVGAFIRECSAQADYAAEEIKRLQSRKRVLENAAERVRKYVLWIMQALEKKKLEGDKFTFATRGLKPKLEITDEALVPSDFKTATITVPAEWLKRWGALLIEIGIPAYSLAEAYYGVDEDQVRMALDAAPVPCTNCDGSGIDDMPEDAAALPCPVCQGAGVIPPSVPGARLVDGRMSLVLR